MITTSKTKAINLAIRMFRKEYSVKYLKNKVIKPGSTLCNCGETQCVTIYAMVKSCYESITIGYCKSCGE